ncbi:RRM_6 domain-containing protein [Cephalotus follicularis]|uniref:RRM_6 domain-containing protein n=1 Tax=Cephalotus follicularis TaxID=3775 RepID=A0A1Q3CQQ0_CEPFO|nr:RRM_6 domain-containing protein [Cephalotus follicularis]
MSTLNLTVEVLSLSTKVTLVELIIFFSYCGTVDKIQLQRNKDQSQSALVTFRQPFAYQTALLLSDAVLAGQPIHIVPANDSGQQINILPEKELTNPRIPLKLTGEEKNEEMQGLISSVHAVCSLWLKNRTPMCK